MPSLVASSANATKGSAFSEPPQTLLSRDFVLLFCMTMFCNSFVAVFYCFEQWLEALSVSPNWRGILLSSMFVLLVILWFLERVFLMVLF